MSCATANSRIAAQLARKGRPALIAHRHGHSYGTSTGEVDVETHHCTTKGVLLPLPRGFMHREGSNILAGDQQLLLPGEIDAPSVDDRVTIGTEAYTIIEVSPLNPGGTNLLYDCIIRGAGDHMHERLVALADLAEGVYWLNGESVTIRDLFTSGENSGPFPVPVAGSGWVTEKVAGATATAGNAVVYKPALNDLLMPKYTVVFHYSIDRILDVGGAKAQAFFSEQRYDHPFEDIYQHVEFGRYYPNLGGSQFQVSVADFNFPSDYDITTINCPDADASGSAIATLNEDQLIGYYADDLGNMQTYSTVRDDLDAIDTLYINMSCRARGGTDPDQAASTIRLTISRIEYWAPCAVPAGWLPPT